MAYLTAEDPRELLVARLARLMEGMGLSSEDRGRAAANFFIWDLSGATLRLAELDERGNIQNTPLADRIVERFTGIGLVKLIMDPAVSFGPGERLVNDAEQAVIIACRRIVRGLGCCVRLLHHSGKGNARGRTTDAYAARGGSALPDGARMVAVLHPANRDDPLPVPAALGSIAPTEHLLTLSRPKCSYCALQPAIWIARDGYRLRYAIEIPEDPAAAVRVSADQIERFLVSEISEERYYTARMLEDSRVAEAIGNRALLRRALTELRAARRVVDAELPAELRHAKRQTYLRPISIAPSRQANPAQYTSEEAI